MGNYNLIYPDLSMEFHEIFPRAFPAESWQRWLRAENAQGADIYISQNALRENTRNHTNADVAAIRHVYLDLDKDGERSLAAIQASEGIPQPNYVLSTSPSKYQVICKVEGMGQGQAEGLQHRMAEAVGGDPAATDSTRVLRLPGFVNKKYAQPFYVVAEAQSREAYRVQDFKLSYAASEHQAVTPAGANGRQPPLAARTQSERSHELVTRGPYRFIRHPGYLAMMIIMPATAVALGSLLALAPALCYSVLILWRTKREDEFLTERLAGYTDYAARVHCRLTPGVW